MTLLDLESLWTIEKRIFIFSEEKSKYIFYKKDILYSGYSRFDAEYFLNKFLGIQVYTMEHPWYSNVSIRDELGVSTLIKDNELLMYGIKKCSKIQFERNFIKIPIQDGKAYFAYGMCHKTIAKKE